MLFEAFLMFFWRGTGEMMILNSPKRSPSMIFGHLDPINFIGNQFLAGTDFKRLVQVELSRAASKTDSNTESNIESKDKSEANS